MSAKSVSAAVAHLSVRLSRSRDGAGAGGSDIDLDAECSGTLGDKILRS